MHVSRLWPLHIGFEFVGVGEKKKFWPAPASDSEARSDGWMDGWMDADEQASNNGKSVNVKWQLPCVSRIAAPRAALALARIARNMQFGLISEWARRRLAGCGVGLMMMMMMMMIFESTTVYYVATHASFPLPLQSRRHKQLQLIQYNTQNQFLDKEARLVKVSQSVRV